MRERRSLFVLVVLVLATVIPMATSADRDSATGTPIPIMATATPTPTSGDDIVCFDMSTVGEAAADSLGTSDGLGAGNVPDHQAVQAFRADLLGLLDTLEEINAELPPQMRERNQDRLRIERQRIAESTDQELDLLRTAFADSRIAGASLKLVRAEILAAKEAPPAEGTEAGRPLNSFPIIPTPTPVTTPPPGIEHDEDRHEQVNEEAGDLFVVRDIGDVGCPADGYAYEVNFGMMVAIDALKVVSLVLDVMCKEKTVTCPGANVQDPPVCWASAIATDVTSITEDVNEGFNYCNNLVQQNLIQSTFENLQIIHADLHDHDQNLTTRFNMTDKFLFDFRNLNLRLNVEANLASPGDDPQAAFTLPRAVCISTALETLQEQDSFSPDVIAGCGLLEIVSDTVKSGIDMTIVASGPDSVHNAQAEFDAAVQHYNNQEWKLAYARFRKAYREAVRP
ncbi:MAG: hypothetical protein WBW48_00705 [Anaerolineae bacterium]